MLLKAYRLALFASAPLLIALLYIRAWRGLEEDNHLKERRGLAFLPRPAGRLIWLHAASVGEMKSIQPLITRLLAQNADLTCLVTTVTVTAARLTRRLKNPRILHQYAPLDRRAWIARFLDHWKPDACIWVESEFWPNMLSQIHEKNIPLMLVNGRLSARSAARWARAPKVIKELLGYFDRVLAQSPDDLKRLKGLGAKDGALAGNMKFSGAPLSYDKKALHVLREQLGGRPLVLFASTHEGEEAMAARVCKSLAAAHPSLLGVILPRHPVRGESIGSQVEKEGALFARRALNQPIAANTQIYIADTLGETGLFYRLTSIVYVGNSLISRPGGGHNPIEPAQLGCAIVYGPHMWNFSDMERHLREAGGSLLVRDERALGEALDSLLSNPQKAANLAAAAQRFVAAQNDVLDKVSAHLRPALARAGIAA